MNDTIFALASGSTRTAVAVLRISGPATDTALIALGAGTPQPRRASLRTLRNPGNGGVLDQALVLRFAGPSSFTGEDGAELHLHGGKAVLDGVGRALELIGLRPATPGEFTRRAFENGKLDLLQAEAIADLVDSETEAQRLQALESLDGALSGRVAGWRETLLSALALLEAEIDFPDEDLPADIAQRALNPLRELQHDFEAALFNHHAEQVRDGFKVAIIGPPNSGKSSLFNALLRRDAAIVTPIAGTTRDVIEARLVIEGRLILLADTAGDRDTTDVIEQEGVRRARAWADAADLRLHLHGPDQQQKAREGRPSDMVIFTKADLVSQPLDPSQRGSIAVSAKTGEGMAGLEQALAERVRAPSGPPGLFRARHRTAIAQSVFHVKHAIDQWQRGVELRAESLRSALLALETLVGYSGVEDVLDRLFADFCIGK